MAIEQRYTAFEKAKNYTKQYELDGIDSIVTRQEDDMLGYVSAGQFATTGSNIFTGGQILVGNLTIDGDIYANTFNVTTVSISHFSASTNFGIDEDDTHTFTGSVYITGSLNVIGGINGVINATNGVISSSAQITSFGFVSGSYETTGRGIISSSAQLPVGVISGSAQITTFGFISSSTIPAGTISGSAQITSFGFVSGSYETTGRSIISSSAQITSLGFISSSQTLDTASLATTGSNLFRGDEVISGSLFISGTTELGGNIVPKTARGATLGTSERPFSEIFVSSGSINIASDTPGDPNTTLTNVGGNILVSAGGMRLVGDASFIAATGSFQYLSGSFTHIGSQFNEGDIITTGSLQVSGSTIQIGNNTQIGNNILIGTTTITGSLTVSGSQTLIGTQILRGDKIVTGSISISGSQTFIGNQSLLGDKSITGSLNITGSGFINNRRILTDLDSGSYAITGSNTFSGSQGISGSLYVSQSIYVNDEFYLNGNKLFNYGQFSDTTTQSGSANTAYSMKFNTTDISHYVSVVSGSRLTVANTGIYNLQFSAQLDNTSNTNEIVDIWVAITGSNVANSNTQVAINKAQAGNSGKLVAAWNYMLPLSASNYVELKWSSNGGGIILSANGSASNPTRPGIPSAIATITQIA